MDRLGRSHALWIMRSASPLHPKLQIPRRRQEDVDQWQQRRESWLAELEPRGLFHRLFDQIPGVYFFAKDAEGHTMFVSRGILERYRMADETEMIGLTDFDINPGSMAASYVEDDRRILGGGADRIERMELWFDRQGTVDWFIVTKLPLLDRDGRVRGVMGILRRPEQTERQLPVFQTVAHAVEHIRRDYGSPLLIADVAKACGLSPRQLQRRFQDAFGMTPQEFLLRTRITAAARLLEETNLPAGEIAEQCGFVDQSSFSLHFRKWTGMSPIAYRKARGGAS